MSLKKDNKFCPLCDFAIPREEINKLKHARSARCRRCGGAYLSDFYSYGSLKHGKRRSAFERGEISGNPVPTPEAF